MKASGWTCQRVTAGERCKHHNPPRTRKCGSCGKPRPPKRQPAHMSALDMTYEEYVVLNGGEFCGICRRPPSESRDLDRDHAHTIPPVARGLLCWRCNKFLQPWMTSSWLRAAADYLERNPA